MTPDQAIKIINMVVALCPQQRFTADTPQEWHAAGLKDVGFDEAAFAARRLIQRQDRITLADLLREVRSARAERLARHPLPAPPADVTTATYLASLRATLKRIADGWAPPSTSPLPPSLPTDAYRRARGVTDPNTELRTAARRVACPWPPCKAPIGFACTTAGGHTLDAPAHEARLIAAGIA